MPTFRKPRADSRLGLLDEEDKLRLLEWFVTPGMSLERIRDQVAKPEEDGGLGIETSRAALSNFWSANSAEYLINRRRQARDLAAGLAEEAAKSPAQFEAATIDAIAQQAFTMAQQPGVAPADVKAMFSLVLKVRDQDVRKKELELADRRVALLERKAEQADKAAGIAADGQLSAAEKEARIKAVFGIQ